MKRNLLIFFIVSAFIIPQVTFAAWYNPTSWGIFSWVKKTIQIQFQLKPQVTTDSATTTQSSNATTSTIKKTETIKSATSTSLNKPVAKPTLSVLSNSQIIKKIKPAIVYISTQTSAGSGMIFSTDGYVLTNAHVVKGVTNVSISLSTGNTLYGTVAGRDEAADLAVIKLNTTEQLPKIDFGDSGKTEQGDEVFAFGFPFGIEGDVSFKEGTISRRIEGYLETSAEIHPGNSGGPLVNKYGQVIGVNTAIFGKSISGIQLGETIKLAIPINNAKNLIAELKAGRNIIVESQKEKQAKQEATNRNACLAESEQYYNNLVNSINQLNINDSNLQNLLSQIDQEIESVKRGLNDDISRITSSIDGTISELRRIAEKQIAGYQNTFIRSRSGVSGSEVYASSIAAIQSKLNSDITYYESQKQWQISSAQSSVNAYIQKYEALKAKARSDKERSTQAALTNAKTEKTNYYNECIK